MKKLPIIGILLGAVAAGLAFFKRKQAVAVPERPSAQEMPATPGTTGSNPTTSVPPSDAAPPATETKPAEAQDTTTAT